MINIINTIILIGGLIILKFNITGISSFSPIGNGLYENKLFWLPSVMILLFSTTHILYYKIKNFFSAKSYYNFINISCLLGFLYCVYFLSYNELTIILILLALIINDLILNIYFKVKRIAYLPIFICLSLISLTYLHLYLQYEYKGNSTYLDMSIYPLIIKEYLALFLFYCTYRLLNNIKINKFIIYIYTIGIAVLIIIGTNYGLSNYEEKNVKKLETFRKMWIDFQNQLYIKSKENNR